MKYILSVTEDKPNYGFKAKVDILEILKNNDYKELYIDSHSNATKINIIKDIRNNKRKLKKFLVSMKENSKIVMQYPWYSMTLTMAKLIRKYCRLKKCQSVVVIHDINSLRLKSIFMQVYFNVVVNEYKFLDCFDKIICHNESMKRLLVSHGISENKIVCLNLFDYLGNGKKNVEKSKYRILNIAGNLNREKAGFAYKLSELNIKNYSINLYGMNYDGINNDTCSYKGSFDPVSLLKELKNGFGLVWDGESLKSCSGAYGEYLRINNPHKLSLYMAAGMPVIVWKESAIAKFVLENKIGFAVDSLTQLEEIFRKMTDKEYEIYLKNAKRIQDKVLNGTFIMEALEKSYKEN